MGAVRRSNSTVAILRPMAAAVVYIGLVFVVLGIWLSAAGVLLCFYMEETKTSAAVCLLRSRVLLVTSIARCDVEVLMLLNGHSAGLKR